VSFVVTTIYVYNKLLESKDLKAAGICKKKALLLDMIGKAERN
jgi:hypothetical protein